MKNKILDAAEELFVNKGFDNTSTKDIMDKAGISRGTLYNHFSSKEAVLDAVIERITGILMKKAEEISTNDKIPILERLTMTIMSLNQKTLLNSTIIGEMHKPQNALLHQKSQSLVIKGIVPILGRLVEEGKVKGVFNTKYGIEAVEMIMVYSNTIFDDINKDCEQKINGFIYNVERLMGTKEGELANVIMPIFNSEK